MIEINGYKLSDQESEIVQSALELYARLHQGQFSQVGHLFYMNNLGKISDNVLKKVKSSLDQAQILLHGDTNTSWRITNGLISKSALKAYRLELIAAGDMKRAEEVMNLAPIFPLHDKFGHDNNSLIDPQPE